MGEGEVAWEPGLTERPTNGVWVRALDDDGVLVTKGMIGCVAGAWLGQTIIQWEDDHQCVMPLSSLARINRPRRLDWTSMRPPSSWQPDPLDRGSEGAYWPWIRGVA